MRFDIITIFPEMFESMFSSGIVKKALERGLLQVNIHNLRDYADNKHQQVDDRPFGGSAGMVLKPEPIFSAVDHIRADNTAPVYLLSPQGKQFDSNMANKLAEMSQIILICGRYDGVDERVIQNLVTEEISIGDYILSGGEPAAWVVIDAAARFIPGVVGKSESVEQDSFFSGLLDYPQYTRPREFKGMNVPEILFSGDHKKIEQWRRKKILQKTWLQRADLLQNQKMSSEDIKILKEIKSDKKGKKNEYH